MLGWAAMFAIIVALGATPADTDLDKARAALQSYDYASADRALVLARARLPDMDESRAVETLRLSAVVALSLDRFEEAEEFLLALLVRSPTFEPAHGAWPPPWVDVYQAARRRVPDQYAPDVRLAPRLPVAPRAPFDVRARIYDPSGVANVRVIVSEPRIEVTMTSTNGTDYVATIPSDVARSPAVHLWIEAFDAYGNGPGPYGRSQPPVRIDVQAPVSAVSPSPPPPAEATDNWWFWVIAGAVVVAAGTSAVVLATRADDSGTITARVQWP